MNRIIRRHPAVGFAAAVLLGVAACQSTGGSARPEEPAKRKGAESKPSEPAANPQVAELRKALRDPDMSVRLKGVELIGPGVAGSEEGASVLVGALGDSEPLVRRFAAEALSGASPSAPTLLGLARTLSDPETDPRESSSRVLAKLIAQAPDSVVPELGAKLGAATADSDESVRRNALEALGKLGDRGPRLVPSFQASLERALSDKNDNVRAAAVAAVGELGPAFQGRVQLLAKAVGDPVHDVRKYAIVALEKIGPDAAPAAMALAGALRAKEIYIRVFAADALAAIGPGARAALPALRKLAASGYKDIKGSKEMEAKDLPASVAKAIKSISGKETAKGGK